jgi:hypothetical protein
MAQPSRYTPDLAGRILQQLRAGRPLRAVCAEPGMPSARTVQGWVRDGVDGFAAAYRAARGDSRPRGTPEYMPDIADRIFKGLRAGRALAAICRDAGMPPYATVRDWIRHDRHGFAAPCRAALRAGGTRFARPTRYTRRIANVIFEGLCEGLALETVCAKPGMPTAAAVRRWVREDRDGFAAAYLIGRRLGCDKLADDMLKIIDDRRGAIVARVRNDGSIEWVFDPGHLRRAKLRVDARDRLLSRRLRDIGGGWLVDPQFRAASSLTSPRSLRGEVGAKRRVRGEALRLQNK